MQLCSGVWQLPAVQCWFGIQTVHPCGVACIMSWSADSRLAGHDHGHPSQPKSHCFKLTESASLTHTRQSDCSPIADAILHQSSSWTAAWEAGGTVQQAIPRCSSQESHLRGLKSRVAVLSCDASPSLGQRRGLDIPDQAGCIGIGHWRRGARSSRSQKSLQQICRMALQPPVPIKKTSKTTDLAGARSRD